MMWYGTRPRGWISFIRTLAGIIWKFMKSRNVPNTSVKLWFVESQYFLLHIKAAWNLMNSSAFNSSRDMISLTMCWGNKVNDPKLRTSFPWSSTNSKTWNRNVVWGIYLETFKFLEIWLFKWTDLLSTYLIHEVFSTFILNVTFSGRQQRTDSVDGHATLNKPRASLF